MGLKWFSIVMGRKSKSSSSSSSSGAGSVPSTPPNTSSPSAFPMSTQDGVGRFRQLFDHLDADGDGRISVADLESSLSRVGGGSPGCARGDAASMLWAADLDGDGYISLEELASVCGARVDEAVQRREEELRSAFEVYDRNGDGVITAEELHQPPGAVRGHGERGGDGGGLQGHDPGRRLRRRWSRQLRGVCEDDDVPVLADRFIIKRKKSSCSCVDM